MMQPKRTNLHSDREWLVPMAVIAACQFALWWVLWAAGVAKQPMLQAYSEISVIGLGKRSASAFASQSKSASPAAKR